MKYFKLFCLIQLLIMATSGFSKVDNNYYRIFWNPTLHGQFLAYCQYDRKICGKAVADKYCQWMGFEYSNQYTKAYNIGLTTFIDARFHCKGWECNGFKSIRCVGKIKHTPPRKWHYRYERFVYPRFNNYRLDWCYDGKSGCGRRAAFSYCRSLGYMNVKSYKRQNNIAATKAIRNQKLCFKDNCSGFSVIECER